MKLPKKYFLYVGNAYPHKNLDRLVEAFQSLGDTAASCKLVLVGPQDYFYKRLKEKVQNLGLKDRIIFFCPASGQALTNLYKNAIALVFPSLMEGFGLPAVEAMVNGCLVLCSDIPVFHEVLSGAAVYFKPDDKNDIKEKMGNVFNQPDDYSVLIEKGFAQVKQYSWRSLATRTLEIYKEVVR